MFRKYIWSHQSKALCITDSQNQLLPHFLFAAIFRNKQVIKAGVRAWEHLAVFTVATNIQLHCAEAVDRGAVTSCRES
jgi:hypothetical protein